MVDEVLRGIAGSDFADVLLRAAAFARVVATGRAATERPDRRRGAADAGALRAARGRRPRRARPRTGLSRDSRFGSRAVRLSRSTPDRGSPGSQN